MRRIALSPTWCARHLLMLVLVAAFAFLGRWQWDRAMSSTGSLQNLLYAFEWWVFAGMVVWGWFHLLRDEVRVANGTAPAPAPAPTADLPAFATAARAPAAADDEADAELAAYNAYLAWLAENPRR